MQGYILSILGIVIISVLTEILLPSGQTAKYIRSLLAVFVVYVLINPIITLLKSDFDINKFLVTNNIELDKNLLNAIYSSKIEAKQTDLENLLEEQGYTGVKICIEYEIVDQEVLLSKVKVNIDNLVITSSETNINKYQYIRQVVLSQLAIKEEDIIFEWKTQI